MAFKMKGPSLMKMVKQSGMKMKQPMKLKKDSPMDLNKGFDKLPEDVQSKILKKDSPKKMKKGPMKKTYREAWEDMKSYSSERGKYKDNMSRGGTVYTDNEAGYKDFVKNAKAYNKKKYGTTEPAKAVNKVNKVTGGKSTKADLAKAKKKVDAGTGSKLSKTDVSKKTIKGANVSEPMSTPPKASEVKPKSKRKNRLEAKAQKLEEKGKKTTGRRKNRLAKRQEKIEKKASAMTMKKNSAVKMKKK